MVEICERFGFSRRLASALMNRGMARARLGELEQGIEGFQRGFAISRREVFHTPERAALLAELLLQAHRASEAETLLDEIDAHVAGTDEAAYLAECQRVRGVVAAASDDPARAEQWFDMAITTARRQSARLFELRATTHLAELLEIQ